LEVGQRDVDIIPGNYNEKVKGNGYSRESRKIILTGRKISG